MSDRWRGHPSSVLLSGLPSLTLAVAGTLLTIGCQRSGSSSRPAADSTFAAPVTPVSSAEETARPSDGPCNEGARGNLAVTPSPGVTFGDYTGDATVWKMPAALHLEVEPPTANQVVVRIVAVLSNVGSETLDIPILAGGVPGSTNPWDARLNLLEMPHPPVPRFEVYPYPARVTLPPGGGVRYTLDICRANYSPSAGRPIDIVWSFELWGEYRRTGKSPESLCLERPSNGRGTSPAARCRHPS